MNIFTEFHQRTSIFCTFDLCDLDLRSVAKRSSSNSLVLFQVRFMCTSLVTIDEDFLELSCIYTSFFVDLCPWPWVSRKTLIFELRGRASGKVHVYRFGYNWWSLSRVIAVTYIFLRRKTLSKIIPSCTLNVIRLTNYSSSYTREHIYRVSFAYVNILTIWPLWPWPQVSRKTAILLHSRRSPAKVHMYKFGCNW